MNGIANQAAIAPQYWRPNTTQINRTFADARIDNSSFLGFEGFGRPYNWNPPKGYGMDLNGDGKFDPKQDGYLSFDLNRDGKHTDQEIQQSRNLLKAFSGDFDVNNDGRVDYGEYFQGYSNFFQARSMDIDRDGVLSKWELQKAGGSVVKKADYSNVKVAAGTELPKWNSYSLDFLPNNRRLEYLNPWRGTFTTSQNNFFRFPLPNMNVTNAGNHS